MPRIYAGLTKLSEFVGMDNLREVTLKLPEPLIADALRLAQHRDMTLGQVLRDALGAEIRRSAGPAKTPNRADEQLLAPLRVLLATDFAQAHSWADLSGRLQQKGYALCEAGGGLALHSHPKGVRLCKASELGHAYMSLMRRFGAPFPGHRHRHLVDKVLGPAHSGPDDICVIEPF